LGRLPGRGIVVRLARDGEQMETLDGVVRTFTCDDLLICDGERNPQGIAGIMGGAAAEVSDDTTEILLESAYFEASGIAKTSKRLGLRSEASARFERGVDPNGVGTGAQRAMDLFAQVATAQAAAGAIDVYPQRIERPRITVRTPRVNQFLGRDDTSTEIRGLLTPLGIETEGDGDTFVALAPTWRPDLEREIDVIEEVARRVGLQHITRTIPSSPEKIGGLTPAQRDRRTIADVLVGAGYDEAYTLPLLAPVDLTRAGYDADGVIEVENPLRAEESILRPYVLPGLLRAAAFNASHGNPDVALFELGTVFSAPSAGQTLPDEGPHVAAVRTGRVRRAPHEPDRDVTAADMVAAVEALAQELRLASFQLVAGTWPGMHPVRTAHICVDGNVVGAVGEVDALVLEELDLPTPVVACELDVSALLAGTRRPRRAAPVSRFPASTIDLAFVVAETEPADAVLRSLVAGAGELAESVELFDVFRSDAIGEGFVSLAFAVRFRALDRTLTDDEVAVARQRAIEAVTSAHPARLRD
jgi:phenylalanyl-tRNA synthetase beta chain